jgi:hypothetical protein
VSTRRTRAFWHFTLGGERSIDEEEILDETVESVTCRWCGKSSSIEMTEGVTPLATPVTGDLPQETNASH